MGAERVEHVRKPGAWVMTAPWRLRARCALAVTAACVLATACLLGSCSCGCSSEARLRKDQATVRAELARLEPLPPEEKARRLWALWTWIVPRDSGYLLVWAEDAVIGQLIDTGEPGMEVLLEEIRRAPNSHAHEAWQYLAHWGESPIEPLLRIVKEGNDDAKYWALSSLDVCAVLGLSPEHHAQALEAASQLQSHPNIPLATKAAAVVRTLGRNPPVEPSSPGGE